MLTLILLFASQLLAASGMPQLEQSQPESSTSDIRLFGQLFGLGWHSFGTQSKGINTELLVRARAKYPAEFGHKHLTAEDLNNLLGPWKSCDRMDMDTRLAIGVLIHNDHPEFNNYLVDRFQDELTNCLDLWLPNGKIEDVHIGALLESIGFSKNAEQLANWRPATMDLVADAISGLGMTNYGNDLLQQYHVESISELRQHFDHELSVRLPKSCRKVDKEWRIIGRAWLMFAQHADKIEISSPKFQNFIETLNACSIIVAEPELIEKIMLSKYSYLYQQLFLRQPTATLTAEQTKNGIQIMFQYCSENAINIPDKETISIFLNMVLDNDMTAHELKEIYERRLYTDNQNIATLARVTYELNMPTVAVIQRRKLIRAIEKTAFEINNSELYHLDRLLDLVEKFRRELGYSPEVEFIHPIQDQALSKALAHYFLPTHKKCVDKLLGCLGGKPIEITEASIMQKFGHVCGLLADEPRIHQNQLEILAENDFELVNTYIKEKPGLMLWVQRIGLCTKLNNNDIEYDLANEYLIQLA